MGPKYAAWLSHYQSKYHLDKSYKALELVQDNIIIYHKINYITNIQINLQAMMKIHSNPLHQIHSIKIDATAVMCDIFIQLWSSDNKTVYSNLLWLA